IWPAHPRQPCLQVGQDILGNVDRHRRGRHMGLLWEVSAWWPGNTDAVGGAVRQVCRISLRHGNPAWPSAGRTLAQFGVRKRLFVQCFVLDWRHYGLGRGGKRDPKHCTKEFRGSRAMAYGSTGWPGMVDRTVLPACGDDQSDVTTGATPRPGAISALSAGRGGHGPAAGLDTPPGAGLSATPPAGTDA